MLSAVGDLLLVRAFTHGGGEVEALHALGIEFFVFERRWPVVDDVALEADEAAELRGLIDDRAQ